jgi:hypothetical protein
MWICVVVTFPVKYLYGKGAEFNVCTSRRGTHVYIYTCITFLFLEYLVAVGARMHTNIHLDFSFLNLRTGNMRVYV